MKKRVLVISFLLIILFCSITFVSASWFSDIMGKITGNAINKTLKSNDQGFFCKLFGRCKSDTSSNPSTNKKENLTYGPGDYSFNILLGNITRKYLVHVPASYSKDNATPLIINFHGGGSNAEGQIQVTLMNSKSNYAGFIVVYPEGYPSPQATNAKTWNAGDCCAPATTANSDDIGFVRAMIPDIESKFNINSSMIYATGYSNGAMMANMLACDMADTFAAISSVAGGVQIANCSPSRPISVMTFHGTADGSFPYNGGDVGGKITGIVAHGDSANKTASDWATRDNCNMNYNQTYQNGDTTCITYSQCTNNNEITFCTIKGGGHTWPDGAYGGNSNIQNKILEKELGKITHDINANNAMWTFFQKHTL